MFREQMAVLVVVARQDRTEQMDGSRVTEYKQANPANLDR